MRLLRLASRVTFTAVRLPFAIVWDAVRIPGIAAGYPSSVAKVIKEHEQIKRLDEAKDDQ